MTFAFVLDVLGCLASQFECDNRVCVSRELECDGVDNCGDNSDEIRPCGEYIIY